MNLFENITNGLKELLGGSSGDQLERIGDHAVAYDEQSNELYCARCYKSGKDKRFFIEEECDAPEESHDIVPHYPRAESDPLNGILDSSPMNQRTQAPVEPDGYMCMKCGKWDKTREDLEERECDPY